MVVISDNPTNTIYSGKYDILKLNGSNVIVYSSNVNNTVNNTNTNTNIIENYSYQNIRIINNNTNSPSLLIEKRDSVNIIVIYDNTSNISFNIPDIGNIGINKYASSNYNVDVNGITNSTLFKGDGFLLNNINLNDRTDFFIKRKF